jgi:hypothetical protein
MIYISGYDELGYLEKDKFEKMINELNKESNIIKTVIHFVLVLKIRYPSSF